MNEDEEELRIWIVVRQDLPEMTSGKLVAQAGLNCQNISPACSLCDLTAPARRAYIPPMDHLLSLLSLSSRSLYLS